MARSKFDDSWTGGGSPAVRRGNSRGGPARRTEPSGKGLDAELPYVVGGLRVKGGRRSRRRRGVERRSWVLLAVTAAAVGIVVLTILVVNRG